MGSVGAPEIMVILLIGLVLLGPTKLPEMARQGAKMLAEFKRVSQSVQQELRAEFKAAADATAPAEKSTPDRNGSSQGS